MVRQEGRVSEIVLVVATVCWLCGGWFLGASRRRKKREEDGAGARRGVEEKGEKRTEAGGKGDGTEKEDEKKGGTERTDKENVEEEAEAKELSIYTRKDAFGNWTEAVQQQNNMVDWSHPDSSVKVNRIISYY